MSGKFKSVRQHADNFMEAIAQGRADDASDYLRALNPKVRAKVMGMLGGTWPDPARGYRYQPPARP